MVNNPMSDDDVRANYLRQWDKQLEGLRSRTPKPWVAMDLYGTLLMDRRSEGAVLRAALSSLIRGDTCRVEERLVQWREWRALRRRKRREWSVRDFIDSVGNSEELESLEIAMIEALKATMERRELGCTLMKRARARGLPVYVISDTWYTSAALRELLQHFGLQPEGILSSADFGVSKASGRLYPLLFSSQTSPSQTPFERLVSFRLEDTM